MKKTLLSLALALALALSAAAYETSAPGRDNPIAAAGSCVAAAVGDGSLWTEGWERPVLPEEADGSGGQAEEESAAEEETPENPEEPGPDLGEEAPSDPIPDQVVSVSWGGCMAFLQADGTLWTWGGNDDGQLGDGSQESASQPVRIMSGVVAVSSGGRHTAAVQTDGSLWTWGNNDCGQLGDGSRESSSLPVKILDGVAAVSAGDAFTAAIKNNGTLWTWGSNDRGQLGTGSLEESLQPVKILDNVTAVSCGAGAAAAVLEDGSLWLWGNARRGRQDADALLPAQVMEGVVAVSVSGSTVAAVRKDGSLWVWPLGGKPAKMMEEVAAVALGEARGAALKTDGTLWLWEDGGSLTQVQDLAVYVPSILLTGFADVPPDAYYVVPVTWAVENGITRGTSTNGALFSPEKTCTTGEILTFLWRAMGEPEPTAENPFTDVKVSDYYYKAALWAYENDLLAGPVFNAGASCTRSMTVTYLWKLAGSPAARSDTFSDVPAHVEYAQAVAWAVERGITKGTGEAVFSPAKTCNRAEIVTFLYRALATLRQRP